MQLKFSNATKGRLLKRSLFAATNDFSRSLEKQMANGNGEVITTILQEDQTIAEKGKKSKSAANRQKPKVPRWSSTETTPDKTGMCLEMEMLCDKSLGVRKIKIDNISIAPEEYRVREINPKWVQEIKNTLLEYPGNPVTTIPGLIDPAQETATEKTDEIKVIALGGNHLLSAIKQVMTEEGDNTTFDCIRYINVELYNGLNNDEARFVASLHNKKTKSIETTFQDKVRVCRRTFLQHGQSEEISWKHWAAMTLGHLNNREYTIESLSTVFSVSSYTNQEYDIVEELFREYETVSQPGQSYPQNLFRALQGVKTEKVPYLSRAQGTNGIKESHKVIKDKKKAAVRKEFARMTKTNSWDEAQEMFPEAAEKIDRLAVCQDIKGKEPTYFPRELYEIANRATNFEEEPITNITIYYKVIIDGKEINNPEILAIVNKQMKKIKNDIKTYLKDDN